MSHFPLVCDQNEERVPPVWSLRDSFPFSVDVALLLFGSRFGFGGLHTLALLVLEQPSVLLECASCLC